MVLLSSALLGQGAYAFTQQTNNQPYEEALKSFYGSDLLAAEIHLKNALRNQPDHLPSLILLAEVYIEQGDGAAAEDFLVKARAFRADEKKILPLFLEAYLLQQKYKKVIELATSNILDNVLQSKIHVLKGRAHVELNELEQGKAAYQAAIDFQTSNILAQLGMAQVYILKQQPELARPFIEQALAINTSDVQALSLLANLEQQQGNLQESLTLIAQVIEINPKNFPARLTRASLLLQQEKYHDALKDLEVILADIPNEPRANYLKVVASIAVGDTDSSEETKMHLNNVLTGLPAEVMAQNPIYYYLAGIVSFEQGELNKAQSLLNKYVAIVTNDTRAYKILGRIDLSLGELNVAKSNLIRARLIDPDDTETWSLLGQTLLALGDVEKAQQYFLDVVEAKPEDARALFDLANLQFKTGQINEAIVTLQKSLSLNESESALTLLVEAYRASQQYTKGLQKVSRLLALSSNNSYYHQLNGILLGFDKQYHKARAAFEKAVALDNQNVEAVIHLARMDVVEGNFEQGIERLNFMLKQYPSTERYVRVELANLFKNNGNVEEALLHFEKVYSQFRDSYQALSGIIQISIANNDISKAITLAEEFVSRHNRSGDVYLALANLYMLKRDYAKANSNYVLATKHSVNKVEAYQIYAQAQLKMKDIDGAVLSLERALSWSQNDPKVQITMLQLLLSQQKLEQAKVLLSRLDERQVEPQLLSYYQAQWHHFSGEIDTAIKLYHKSLKQHSTQIASMGLYRLYLEQKKYALAQGTINNWLKVSPDDLIAHVALADSYISEGKYQKAVDYYQTLIKNYGEQPVFLNNIAHAQLTLGQYEQAVVFAEKAFKALPENVSVIDTLAWAYTQNQQYDKSLPLYREALAKQSDNSEVMYHLAYTLIKLGRHQEAKQLLMQVVASKQEFYSKAEAKKLLATL